MGMGGEFTKATVRVGGREVGGNRVLEEPTPSRSYDDEDIERAIAYMRAVGPEGVGEMLNAPGVAAELALAFAIDRNPTATPEQRVRARNIREVHTQALRTLARDRMAMSEIHGTPRPWSSLGEARMWPTPDEAFALMASRWREMSPANRRRAERWPHPAWEWRVLDSIPRPRRIRAGEIRARLVGWRDEPLPLP